MPIQRYPHPFSFGSSASRNPSPNRLKASTVMNIAAGEDRHVRRDHHIGARLVEHRPHSGVGGWAPVPRNDRLAAVMIEVPMRRVK